MGCSVNAAFLGRFFWTSQKFAVFSDGESAEFFHVGEDHVPK